MNLPEYGTYYAEPGRQPFRSVMLGGRDQAFRTAAELAPGSRAERNRFGGDFGDYYPERLRVETWLHTQFVAAGGQPAVRHPVYLVVGESPYLKTWMGEGIAYRVPLGRLDPATTSVTLGDSMGVGPERLGRVYTLGDFATWLSPFPDLDTAKASLPYRASYLEVQIWCQDPEVTLGQGCATRQSSVE